MDRGARLLDRFAYSDDREDQDRDDEHDDGVGERFMCQRKLAHLFVGRFSMLIEGAREIIRRVVEISHYCFAADR